MFTWLQTHIQKHHKIVFGALLVMIIIAFVFTIGNFGGFGGPSNPADTRRDFYGFNLNSSRDMSALQDWTVITFALDRRRLSEEQLQVGIYQRAVMLNLAAQLQIPEPTEEQFNDYVASRPAFMNPMTGQFSQDFYTRFVDSFKNNPSMNEETLTIALIQNYRIEQVRRALGGPGYVLPYMAVEEIKRRDTVWSVDVATLEREDFQPDLALTDEAIADYYALNQFRYETEPGYASEYVWFAAEDLLSEVPAPTEAELSAYYNANRGQWPKDEAGAAKPLEEIREQVVAAWKLEQAEQLTVDAANQLAVDLYDADYAGTVQRGDDSLATFLAGRELELKPLPVITPSAIPANAPLPVAALEQVFALDDNRYYTDGLPAEGGAAIIVLKEVGATSIPPLEAVREEVVADYTKDETARLFNLHGQELRQKLQDAVNTGQSFREAATLLGLSVESFADFTFGKPPQGLDQFMLSTVNEMNQGEVSNLVGFNDVGTIVYVEKKDVPTVATDSPEVQKEMKDLASYTSRATEAAILNELILAGQEKAEPQPQAL